MQVINHPISTANASASYRLTSFHFGKVGAGPKVYIQAALHADEVPGMLVAQVLREQLLELEQKGQLLGEVCLVAVANPIGLAQAIQGTPLGRFDMTTGINFNRAHKHIFEEIKHVIADKLTQDAAKNTAIIRQFANSIIAQWQPKNDAEALKKILLGLAIDADIVLDLHCDNQAVMHLYTGTPIVEQIKPLAALLGAKLIIAERISGAEPFDEACSRLWWELQEFYASQFPINLSCLSTTVELRGIQDVSHDFARQDANAIMSFLTWHNVVQMPHKDLPKFTGMVAPLSGVEVFNAPHDGLLIYRAKLGQKLMAHTIVAELIDPISGATTFIENSVAGLFFASASYAYVLRGMNIGKVAGEKTVRSGNLLSL